METPQEPHELVLGIHPSTRGLGYALFEGPTEPIDWGVAEAKGIDRNRMSLEKVERLVDFYQPAVMVVEDHTAKGARRGRRAVELCETIMHCATTRGLSLSRFPHTQVQEIFEMFGAKTKFGIARKIAEWLPQFEPSVPR